MNRLCVFAHYDKDNIIDDYVIYYLNALKDVCSHIIFVSDCNLPQEEINKLDGITEHNIVQKHGEYDFGSYKRGFLYAKENNIEYDELLFVNDSVYGPIYPLKPIFDKMEKKKCDFWGMTRNRYGINLNNRKKPIVEPHVQSYFILLKKIICDDNNFIQFIENISKEKSKQDVIQKYEIGLSKLLYSLGYKSAVYINKYRFISNCTSFKWDKIILNDNFPFIKTSIVKNGFYFTGEVKTWKKVISKKSDYPIDLIVKNSQRLLDLFEDKYSRLNIYRKIRHNILKHFPQEIRYFVVFMEKNLFIILNTICFHKLKKF